MRRFLISLTMMTALVLPVTAAGTVGAVDIFDNACSGNGASTTACKSVKDQQGNSDRNPIISIIQVAIEVLSFIIGLAAIISLIVGGIRLMTANGDSNSVASARSAIITALVGLAVAALAQTIVLFVLAK